MTVSLMILYLMMYLNPATAAESDQSPENGQQVITPEILVGFWELEHVDYGGTVLTAEDWISFFGENASMEFTTDGIWIMKAGGQTEIYFYEFVDGELRAEGREAPLSLVDGKLVFDTGSGMAMTLVKTDKPGMAAASVDETLLGTWVFEQVLYLPDEIPLGTEMFPLVYGMSTPTLEVVSVGFAVMQLGENKVAFPVEDWHLENGKLVHTEEYDDGTSMVWTFVREGTMPADPEAAADKIQPETAEAVPAQDAAPAETTGTGDRFSWNGATWGMTQEEVRVLAGEPMQAPTAATGHSALVYQFNAEHDFRLVQYNFLPSGALYNITIMAPDENGSFYAEQRENWTALYGEPLTEESADIHSDDDPVAVMMAALMQNSADSDFLGWRADDETVIIMSMDPVNKVCYVEIRRYTDYFRFQ
ncbi:MAG: hypothetical protein MJY70_06225 [Bacteroidales bacterium]|nr:hypothetical protein [Bacteroidales bacterium]